jgi:FkbM family methyltransferase
MAARVGETGRVLAFEPLPACRQTLAQELHDYYPELAPILSISPYALSDFSGETEFVVATEALAYSGLKERKYDWPTPVVRIPVQVRTLDALCADLPSLRFMKIDAEGGEYHILKGAARMLARFRPVVTFEFGMNSLEGYDLTPADMAWFWAEQGYKLYDILGNLLTNEFFELSAQHQLVWDYVAVPHEQAAVEATVVEVLRRPPAWHRVTTHLDMAEHNANVGKTVPRLVGFRGLKRWLARWVARLIIATTQVITRPQRACNRALLHSVRGLVTLLRRQEREAAQQAARITELETLVRELSRRLERQQGPGRAT